MTLAEPNPEPPLRFDAPVTLIGGGVIDVDGLNAAMARSSVVVAADSGADQFVALSGAASVGLHRPPPLRAVVGDMDSVGDVAQWRNREDCRFLQIDEQDSTDLEKCLYSVSAPVLIGVGFLGRRFDHSLAACHALLKFAKSRVILIGEADLAFICPPFWRARLAIGDRLSLYPVAPCRGRRSKGLRWPLDGLNLQAGRQIGVSNIAQSSDVEIEFDEPGALVLLDRLRLDAVIDSFAAAPLGG